MSLRLKFGVLLALLGATVVLAVGASWWALSVVHTEVREPYRSMTTVLGALGDAKDMVEAQRSAVRAAEARSLLNVGSEPVTHDDVAIFERHTRTAKDALRRTDVQDWKIRGGTTSLGNLEQRIDSAGVQGATFLHAVAEGFTRDPGSSPPKVQREAQIALDDLHTLIERIERQVVRESRAAVAASEDLTALLRMALLWALVMALLFCALGMILFRRWVLHPVEAIRVAAGKLAAGEFDYRIPLRADAGERADEMGRLGAEVNHMAGMVKAMQDERVERERLAALGEMMGRLAHNLRQPLSGIRGLAESSRDDLRAMGPQAAEICEQQERIMSAVDRFNKWFSELLTATKPLSVTPEPTPVVPWLTGLVEAHRPMAQTCGVELSLRATEAPEQAAFDARHLEQALSAILSNAVEATSSPDVRGGAATGGKVTVEAAAVARGVENGQAGQDWVISVTDEGSGVPPNLRDSVFRPYFTTKRHGHGIGLAIALQVVKAHGGQIRVESPAVSHGNGPEGSGNGSPSAGGARFTISLPINGPILANDAEGEVARNGRSGAPSGQDPRDRR